MGEKEKETGMGKIYQGVLGGFSGKLGMVVGYTWRGRPCIRVYRHAINYPNTELQQKIEAVTADMDNMRKRNEELTADAGLCD